MGSGRSKLDRRRWRLAHLFKRAWPLCQHADPPCLRTPTPIREANRDAGLEKVAQRPQSRMAWATRRRLGVGGMNAAFAGLFPPRRSRKRAFSLASANGAPDSRADASLK